jgi:parallel beta-helix repeat protein
MKDFDKNKPVSLRLLLVGLVVFAATVSALAREVNVIKDPSVEMGLVMPGKVEGTGTHFNITNSSYLNMTLESSEPINLILESALEMILIDIEASGAATCSEIILNGFEPSTTYYKYEDDYHNSKTFITDENGSYSYMQCLSTPHHVFIQPRPSTKFIPSDTSIGTWDPGTRTFILSTDVYETIQIDEDNLILDGAGYNVTGSETGYGIYLSGRTDVIVRNLYVEGFSHGIHLSKSTGNTITDNIVSRNNTSGVYLSNSNGNALTGNNTSNNHKGIFLHSSGSNLLTANITKNNYYGIYLYYNCNNNMLIDNTATENSHGIYLYKSSDNTLTDNSANSNNYHGICLYDNCNTNDLTANITNWNHNRGIYLYKSSDNTLTGNTASHNYPGIYFYYNCTNNTLISNTTANNYYGIYFYYNCNNNEIYNNNFINNETQAYAHSSSGNVFNLSAPIGGNYWSNWSTPDADRDGFVDNPYVFTSGQDNLPWIRQNAWANQPPTAEAGLNKTVHPGDVVTLDGSGSSDPEEDYPLTYFWNITSKPEGSTAVLSNPHVVNPSFIPDMLDDYVIELVVTDILGAQSEPDDVLVETYNTAPVADAGEDQAIIVIGTTVELDGSQSYDADDDEIMYLWTITQKPAGSLAELSDPCSPTPAFIADVHADYVITLVVTDVFGAIGDTDSVMVSFENIKPVADAGIDQSVVVGDTVSLDASGSTDGNGDLLTYSWNFVSKPAGSVAVFSDPTSAVWLCLVIPHRLSQVLWPMNQEII